ncbi:M28 family peptidase [Bdellovibrionota bacterium FG-2]
MHKNTSLIALAIVSLISLTLATFSCSHAPQIPGKISFPEETHFKNIRQLTAGGTNAEAYWSFNNKWLSFQHKGHGPQGPACDQIYVMRADGSGRAQISNGKGRTTCAYYLPGDERVLFSSTHGADENCPPVPDMSKGYVWPIYETFQIYSAKTDGTDLRLTEPGAPRAYNAEATVCKDGSVIFTSDRDGDLDLYTGKLDSMGTMTQVKRITKGLGYDGGAFFSTDCSRIVWRASRPRKGKEADEYLGLLKKHLVKPSQLEIWVANADGTHARQISRMGAASFAPYFTPDNKAVLFASNPRDPRGRKFEIYKINVDGTGLERVSFSDTFESFPMFSPDGKHIAFSSNRNATEPHETNVFVADWVPGPEQTFSVDDTRPENRVFATVQKLSTDEMEGRGLGTPGLEKAEKFVAERFASIGLKPLYETYPRATDGSGYFHNVEVKMVNSKTPDRIEKGHNIVGTYGAGCGKVGPVVIGAHLDHLGHGAENSLEPSKSGIHHGADDNASGVAAVMEAARLIVADPKYKDSKSACFVFTAFTGEESGIAGSSRLAELFKAMKVQPKVMMNLDMVGRMENNQLIVFGSDSAKEWNGMVQEECDARHLTCPGGGDGYGPSDHMAFFINKAAVLHFFTGPHGDYHRVSDTLEKINATGTIQTAETVAALAIRAMDPKVHFTYQKAPKAPMFGQHPGGQGEKKGRKVYLGTIPDYSSLSSPHGPTGGGAEGGGIKLAGARQGSPAEKAGVKEGDILTGIDAEKINSLEDFMKILGTLSADQKITLVIRRDGKELKLPATVEKKD